MPHGICWLLLLVASKMLTMSSSVHLLLGFPGTGKFTVAKALVAELEQRGQVVKLVDSHYVNNPVFGLVDQDGTTSLPAGIWPIVERVRDALLDTIEELSPPDYSFVFTNFITEASMSGRVAEYVQRLERIAAARGGQLQVTRLTCDVGELCRRIVLPDRVERLKMTNPERVRQVAEAETIYDPPGRGSLTLDITQLSPAKAARRILQHTG